MRLPQRVSFSSPGRNSLLIFCGCCVLVHLIWYACLLTDGGDFTSNEVAISLWASIIGISGRTGNWHLLVPFLCVKLQVTNSMSVPRGRFKTLNLLLRENLLKQGPMPTHAMPGKENKKKPTKQQNRKGKGKKGVQREKEDKYKFKKSKHNLRGDTSQGISYSKASVKRDQTSIKHRVNPQKRPIIGKPQVTNSFRPSQQGTNNSLHGLREGYRVTIKKKKKNRRGKNANEFSPPPPQQASPLFPFTLIGNAILTEDEEEALRRKILAKVDELDPLLCLPKVLCGYSSRRRQKNYNRLKVQATTPTTLEPPKSEDIIDEYLQLLGIHPPVTEEPEAEISNEANKIIKSAKPSNKKATKVADNHNEATASLENDTPNDDESGSSSAESDESANRRYPPPGRPYPGKFLFDRNRDSAENDIDDEIDADDEEVEDFFDEEDMKYIMERERMQKLMSQTGSHSDENWWDPFDKSTMPPMYNYYPPLEPTMYPPAGDDILNISTDTGGITGWFSNMFSNFMPRISWAGGSTKKDDFDIKSDPFFTSFDGRSATNVEGRTFNGKKSDLKIGMHPSEISQGNRGRTGKQLEPKNEDPSEKYRTAVEIGSRVVSPTQCDFIYNGCPLSYVEILAIINEPERQLPTTVKTSPLSNIFTSSSTTTATTTPRPTTKTTTATRKTTKATTTSVATTASSTTATTATTTSPPPTTTKGKWVFVHNKLITPASPSLHNSISMHQPIRQQQRRPPYAAPQQSIVFQQQQQMPQYVPNFHTSHAPQAYHSTQNLPIYSQQTPQQQYQLQLAHLHQILQNSQFHPGLNSAIQHQHTQLTSVPEPVSQVSIPKIPNKAAKTKIRQALPSGEVEISVEYKPDHEPEFDDDIEQEASLPPREILSSQGFNWPQTGNPVHIPQHHHHPYASSSAMSNSFEYIPRVEPFKRKILSNYEFFPTNGYKIRRKNSDAKKPTAVKRKGVMLTSSEEFSSESEENNVSRGPQSEIQFHPKNPMQRKQLASHSIKNRKKIERKHKRKQSHKTALPIRHSSLHHRFSAGRPQNSNKWHMQKSKIHKSKPQIPKNVNMMRKKYVKAKKKDNKRIQKDGNSSENSSENNSSRPSNEQVEDNKEKLNAPARYFKKKNKTRRKTLLNTPRRKPHLHKQSSESIEVEKRPKIAGSNAIDPDYGHPFGSPYAGYYHTPSPATPTSSSFFSYFFGR